MADQQRGLLVLLLCWVAIKAENPPSNLVVGKTPATFQDGGSVSLHCQATAASSYQWFATNFNGYSKDISGSKYNHQSSTGRLTISNLQHGQDDGYFYCVARNNGGKVRSERVVIQVSYLEVTPNVGASSTSAVEGGGLTHEYPEVKSFPKPTFTWRKNNIVLQEDQRISISAAGNLYIGNMDIADLALYRSTVQNTVTGDHFNRGPISINFAVTGAATTPSEIILGPINQVAIDGQTSSVTFECFGSGRPMPTISWTKNGQAISSSSKVSLDQYKKRLTVHNPNKADEGDYKCHANSRKRTANLTVIVQPTFTVQPTNVDKLPQQIAIFACNASGIPQPTMTWFHNGAKVPPSPTERIQINGKKELTFTSLQSGDTGTVQCVATNDAGEAITTAMLNVRLKTVITNPLPSQITAIKGLDKYLPCTVQADPGITINWNWTKDGSPVDGSRMKLQDNGTLRVITVQENDAGTYVCRVQSVAGNATTSGTLSVQETPLAPSTPVVSNIQPTEVRLTWFPPGYDGNSPILSYNVEAKAGSNAWRLIKDDISPSDRQMSILVRNLLPHTQYQFRVRAVNQVGVGAASGASGSIMTLIAAPSQAPLNVNGVPISADSILVQWQIPSPESHNGPLRGFKIAYRLAGVSGIQFIIRKIDNATATQGNIDGLMQFTSYEIKVLAYNDAGDGTYSNPVTVTTAEGVPTAPPQEVTVINITTVSVVLQWKPPPQKQQNGSIRGYKLQAWKGNTPSNIVQRVTDHDSSVIIQKGTLTGLEKFTQYTVAVVAYNGAGDSPRSDTKIIKTEEGAPSFPPSNLTVIQVGKDGLELRWKIPPRDTWNSDYIGFLMKFEPQGVSSSNTLEIKIPNSQLNYYRAGGLLKFKHYKVSVRTYNLNGLGTSNTSAVAWAWTQEDAPSRAPSNLKPNVTGASTVTLNWGPVPNVGQNGQILGYKIYYSVSGRQNTEKEKEINHGMTFSTSLTGLEAFVTYEFQILAYTRIGTGPRSSLVRATTLESTPGPPAHVRFIAVSTTTVKIAWDPPVYPHGIITGYKALCRLNQSSVDQTWKDEAISYNARQRTAEPLSPRTFYRFFLWAKTNQGWSKTPAEAVVYTSSSTDPPAAPFILPIYFSDIGERWITVKWQATSNSKSPLRYFTLQLNKHGGGWQEYSSNILYTARSLKVEGLIPGESYMFRIMATNDRGNSPYSAASTPTTTRLALPIGAPRDVRIRATSPTSLFIEWTAPFPQELGGTLQGFIVKYREQGTGIFIEARLPTSSRQYTLERLKVFTVYGIKVAAVNEKGPGPYTPLYNVSSGEKLPSEAPKNLRGGQVTRTSIAISWVAPSPGSFNGHLMGYKVYAKDLSLSAKRKRRRRRSMQVYPEDRPLSGKHNFRLKRGSRRRRSLPVCLREPGPKLLFVPPHQTTANITNLRKFVKYRFWVRAYNSIGESPPNSSLEITTDADKPGPPAVFTHDAVYNARVDLFWKPPCEPNGEIIEYEIKYGKTSTNTTKEIIVSADKEKQIIENLDMLTAYSFQIRARNSMGYGPPKTFVVKTMGPAVLPGKPGKPVVHLDSNTAVIMWENGDSGNVPFDKFEIQSKADGSQNFETKWEANPDQTKKNQSYVYYSLGNLKPNTGYYFRIIAWNAVGQSEPVFTVQLLPGTPHNLSVIEAKARSVVLNFTPGSSGRAPILTYTIEYNNEFFYDPASAPWRTLMAVRDAHLVWNLLPLTLPNLKPYTDYRFRVIATNKFGSSGPSNASDTIKTLETAPSLPPSNLTVIQVGKDGLELIWKIPPQDTWNSDRIGFFMKFEPQGMSSSNNLEIKIPNSQLNYYRAGGLLKSHYYKVSVRTYNLNGLGTSNTSVVAWAWTKEDGRNSSARHQVLSSILLPCFFIYCLCTKQLNYFFFFN